MDMLKISAMKEGLVEDFNNTHDEPKIMVGPRGLTGASLGSRARAVGVCWCWFVRACTRPPRRTLFHECECPCLLAVVRDRDEQGTLGKGEREKRTGDSNFVVSVLACSMLCLVGVVGLVLVGQNKKSQY